jgi:hypothetical protein
MRELDSSSPASPERWEGGRRQRARHMSLGLRCHPVRVVLAASKGRIDAVMMLSSRADGEVRGFGRFGSPAARRLQPSPLVPKRAGALSGGEGTKERRKKRARCCTSPGALSPNNRSASILCCLAALRGAREQALQYPARWRCPWTN